MADTPDDSATDTPRGPLGVVAGTTHDPARRRTKSQVPTPEERAAMRHRWGLDGFDDIDKQILTVLLERSGIKDRELGIIVGLSREQTNRRKNRPAMKRALEEARLDALAVFQRNQGRAARRLGALIDAKDEMVSIRACLAHLAPLLREVADSGGNDAASFAKFLEEAYTHRENRRTPTTSDGTTPQPATAARA